jgi:hypothetical protein
MQCAQSDDRSRHAGLRPDPLTRKPRKGEHNRRSCSRTNAHQRRIMGHYVLAIF